MPSQQLPPPEDPWLWPSSPVPLARPAIGVVVERYHPTATGSDRFESLSSVHPVKLHQALGTDPGTAVFRYAFDGYDPKSPQSIGDALSTTATLARTVDIGDELVIRAYRPDGGSEFLFHGIATKFGFGLAEGAETVYFVCRGVARKAWETPIAGALMRDADAIEDKTKNTRTDLVLQFNPKGQPNAAPFEVDNGSGRSETFAAVLDPTMNRTPHGTIASADPRKMFTLDMAVRHLIYDNNRDPNSVIQNPEPEDLYNLLVSKQPIPGEPFDPDDPETYEASDIIVRDKPHTGRDWPTAVHDLVRDYAFGTTFRCRTGGTTGTAVPTTRFEIFATQSGPKKKVYLQPRGATLDPNRSNIGSAGIARDVEQVANAWTVQGALTRYEASYVLAPAFPSQASDATTTDAIKVYDANSGRPEATSGAYRDWIFDECGEGHYLNGSTAKVETASSLDGVIGTKPNGDKIPYAKRHRKPLSELLTANVGTGVALRPEVWVSTDYAGPYPGVWDGTGHWQKVTGGGYEVMKDRLGIKVTTTSPNAWKIGEANTQGGTTPPFPRGIIRLVEATSRVVIAGTTLPQVFVRLTCAIEGDTVVSGTAKRRDSSPVEETILRTVDRRDQYKKWVVAAKSQYNPGNAIIVRDDSDDAVQEAEAFRLAAECGLLEGTITIPRITNYYELGDRITEIEGRSLGFRTNTLSQRTADDAAIYPIVESIEWSFEDGKQSTTLHLSDEAQARHQIERKLKRSYK